MTLTERLLEHVAACFTGLWIQSQEQEEALREIAQLTGREDWLLATWDAAQGLRLPGGGAEEAGDPLAALRSLSALVDGQRPALLVLPNFHRYLSSTEIIQTLLHEVQRGKQRRAFVVILSPVVQLPVELEKQFVVLEHELPGREQLREILHGIATAEGELPEEDQLEAVLDASAGLTRYEAEGAYSLALVRHGRVQPDTVWELKTQALKKSGLVSLHRGGEMFADLGGLDALKQFCLRAMRQKQDENLRPRGVLLLGVPGTGKSAFAKALGTETGRPTLVLDVGSLMGSLVGQTEQNIRQALSIADAMAPCILFCDEIEKALAGASGKGDSGVSARLFGSLLTWLNDHTSDVFFIGTCNDISKLPPEFARAERFDGVFFLDLPGAAQKGKIWELYLDRFGLAPTQTRPRDAEWTGAEIRACCRLAALLEIPLTEAAKNVVPVAVTAAESVHALRTWAGGRCLDADVPGIYGQTVQPSTARRKVRRAGPSAN